MTQETRTQKPEEDEELATLLLKAAKGLGWFLPETPDEVEAWEIEAMRSQTTEGEALATPSSSVTRFRPRQTGSTPSTLEHLARAAREGVGKISEDIEERMRRDRDKAEREGS